MKKESRFVDGRRIGRVATRKLHLHGLAGNGRHAEEGAWLAAKDAAIVDDLDPVAPVKRLAVGGTERAQGHDGAGDLLDLKGHAPVLARPHEGGRTGFAPVMNLDSVDLVPDAHVASTGTGPQIRRGIFRRLEQRLQPSTVGRLPLPFPSLPEWLENLRVRSGQLLGAFDLDLPDDLRSGRRVGAAQRDV